MTLTEVLKQYGDDAISLHVPGHHNGTIGSLDLKLSYDSTEITGLDDYHHPEGVIKEAEGRLSRHRYYESKFLVGGTTAGILSVISAVRGRCAVMRNAHKSVFNGLTLNHLSAYLLPTVLSNNTKQYVAVDLDSINEDELKDVRLAVLTYPNYFGETYDIESVIRYFHERNIEVLVDEAHGAHFDITSNFPHSAIGWGADYVVQSYHKTLPALTMSSVIHIHNNARFKDEVYRYLTMLQSSSPSYMMMSSLEQAHEFYCAYDDGLFFKKREQLIDVLRTKFNVIVMDDPLKLYVTREGCTGEMIREAIEQQQIYTELSTMDGVLLILPLWHENDAFPFDELLNRIQHIEIQAGEESLMEVSLPVTDGIFLPIESASSRSISLEQAVGHRAYNSLIPYPPGIPYVLAGEVVTEEHVEYLKLLPSKTHGMINGKMNIIE